MRRVGRRHPEPALGDTQQVIFPHDPLNPFAVDLPFARFQFLGDSPASVARPLHCDLLNFVPQIHVHARRLLRIQKSIVSGADESGRLAHPDYAHSGPGLHFFFDLLVEGAPVLRARSRRCSSTCCKALFKKSISRVCWPILRSSSASLLSSARFFPGPLNARSPCSCNSRRQRCRSLGCTSKARATSTTLCPLFRRLTADCLKSLVNFLRDFMFQFPLSMIFKG